MFYFVNIPFLLAWSKGVESHDVHVMDTAQYLRPLLSNQAQNFTIWALFGHTLHYSKDGGHRASMEAKDILYIIPKMEVTGPPWNNVKYVRLTVQMSSFTSKTHTQIYLFF